jgi:integrase
VSAKRGVRILGPYEQHNGFRIVEIGANGKRESTLFATEAKAQRYKELLEAELKREDYTTATALDEYAKHLADDGNKAQSVEVTVWAVKLLFPEPLPLQLLSAKRCQKLYDDLRARPTKRGQPFAVDTHRHALSQARRFLTYCAANGWIAENPCAKVRGVGKRRPRGKSLGKAGTELRVKHARVWYAKALELAHKGDAGATAGLVAMLLGMRASEIVSRRVSDVESEEAPGDLLYIPCSKTPAGRRTLEVPEILRPLLVAACEGKTPDRYLFEHARTAKPHRRSWLITQVHRICDLASTPELAVPKVTAHSMRGLLATLTAKRGLAGHLIAATLGHENESTTMTNYAAPGSAAAGARLRGWEVLNGGKTTG